MDALAKLNSPLLAHRPELRWIVVPLGAVAAVAAAWFTDLPQSQVQAATIASVTVESAWNGDSSVPSASGVRFDEDAAPLRVHSNQAVKWITSHPVVRADLDEETVFATEEAIDDWSGRSTETPGY